MLEIENFKINYKEYVLISQSNYTFTHTIHYFTSGYKVINLEISLLPQRYFCVLYTSPDNTVTTFN